MSDNEYFSRGIIRHIDFYAVESTTPGDFSFLQSIAPVEQDVFPCKFMQPVDLLSCFEPVEVHQRVLAMADRRFVWRVRCHDRDITFTGLDEGKKIVYPVISEIALGDGTYIFYNTGIFLYERIRKPDKHRDGEHVIVHFLDGIMREFSQRAFPMVADIDKRYLFILGQSLYELRQEFIRIGYAVIIAIDFF